MLLAYLLLLLPSLCFSHPGTVRRPATPVSDALHLPLYKHKPSSLQHRASGSPITTVGLGDFQDETYTVMINVGGTEMQVVLDTGSSDLWVASTACKVPLCNKVMTLYPQTHFQPANVPARLFYGDSMTGTFAFGEIGTDVVGIAGLAIQNQFFAAINNTNTTAPQTGSSGIIGFGFPFNSVIWSELLQAEFPGVAQTHPRRSALPTQNLPRTPFPNLDHPLNDIPSAKRQSAPAAPSLNDVLTSFGTNGPLVSRLAQTGVLPSPQFSITLQRDAIQLGGNAGALTLGGLPAGVANASLTWVPVRLYTAAEGGLNASADTYPVAWEVPLDAVYVDGQKLPAPPVPAGVGVTALLDTGSSLIRGPKNVVAQLLQTVAGSSSAGSGSGSGGTGMMGMGPTFDCGVPHNLTFVIGGTAFPVDPRDFVMDAGGAGRCMANIVMTDPPKTGFLYSWSLGDPFLKSVLASFYFGNITHPSADAPRVGFMSTVPSDAGAQLKSAVAAAQANGGVFSVTTQDAPGGAAISTTIAGVVQSTAPAVVTSTSQPSGARARAGVVARRWSWLGGFVTTTVVAAWYH